MASKSTKRFAPELFDLFKQAYDRTIILRFPEERQARRFAARMNDLRAAMRHEQHPMLSIAEGVTVSYKGFDQDAGIYQVILGPADSELIDIIRQQVDFEDERPLVTETREVKSSKSKPSSSTDALKGFMGRDNGDSDE